MEADEMPTPVQVQQWLDQEDAWMRETVRRHGWAVQYVGGEECCGPSGGAPPFAYTVGLYGFGHPELLAYGLGQHSACSVLNQLGERVRQGERLGPGEPVTIDGGTHRVLLFPFRDDGDTPVLISAQRFYDATQDRPVPVLQVVWDR
jgi:hypothetical protein